MKKVPSTWDETLYIDGYPGKYTVIARRSGDQWYVAGVNAQKEPLNLKLELPMYAGMKVRLICDGKKQEIIQKEVNINKNGILEVTLQSRGGFVLSK
jgi:hypothetical protein